MLLGCPQVGLSSKATASAFQFSDLGSTLVRLGDPGDLASITKDGSNKVSSYVDSDDGGRRVSSGYAFDQATGGLRPTWVSALAALNSMPVIQYPIGEFFENATADLVTPGAARHVFVVVRPADEGGGAIFTFKHTSTTGAIMYFLKAGGVPPTFSYLQGTPSAFQTIDTNPTMTNTNFVLEWSTAGSGSPVLFKINGALQGTLHSDNFVTETGAAGAVLGANLASPALSYHGYMGHDLVCDTQLSAGNALAVRQKLGTIYGISVV